MNDSRRVLSLDFSRGIAIVLVVWAHADIKLMAPSFYTEHLELMHDVIYSFHMPFFFIISAALLRKTVDKYNLDWTGLFRKVTSSLLIPFYSLGICFFIINIITPKALLPSAPSARQMITAMLIRQSDTENLPSGVLWFLFTLIIFAILIYAVFKSTRITQYGVLIAAILLKLFHPYFDSIQIFGFNRVPYYFVFYVVGYMKSDWILNERVEKLTLFFPLLLIVWYLSFICMPFQKPLFHMICGISGSFFLLGLAINLKHSLNKRPFRFIDVCGSNSLLIFVFHMPFFVIIRKVLYAYDLSSSFVGFGLAVTSGVLLPLSFGKVLSFNKILYKLLFGKPYYIEKNV